MNCWSWPIELADTVLNGFSVEGAVVYKVARDVRPSTNPPTLESAKRLKKLKGATKTKGTKRAKRIKRVKRAKRASAA